MRVMLYADDRTAPATASRYCKRCAGTLLADLVTALVAADEPEPGAVDLQRLADKLAP
jgi:hypothetical protein